MSNIKDIKNPAPFYTLKDAAKELNRALEVDYYDAKKLLNMALVYDLQLYIFVRGWEGYAAYGEEMSEAWEEYADVEKHGGYTQLHFDMDATLEAIITARLNLALREGCLLEAKLELINELILRKNIIADGSSGIFFSNILDIQDSFTGNPKNLFLEVFKQRPSHELIRELGKCTLSADVIASVENINIAWIQLLKENRFFHHNAVTPPPVIDTTIEKEGEPAVFQAISRTDLLITHYQISRIIEGSLKLRGRKVETIETLIEKQVQKPRGISPARERAKLAAKTLANYLWSQDRDNKIKIKEMAITVYAELSQTEHRIELPDQAISLKDWIKEVAPPYSREPGRTKEKYISSET
ncbi:hypothetical protein [Acinetobacter baumannii]|uniref:hypothetical protein n=1 Tax=Acinetobacter baumannii TaxID=470 RepID=UPI001CA8E557|nr:hypothetical protein [Acinetobacter baumannii]MCJ9043788.1 hypothetical protein [Acinetobacter baumannii]MCJ9146941.1 hypothetical protein [Acinetobacter baumannii]MCJ9295732.1 hypothetical protein [Acinetobacter baumannii]MCJ9511652.1 hypothetical protein [Acinetobacter baumannii]UAB16430.1 hypothetical protein H2786_01205 [Acinetobacter baumannii]